MAETVLPDVILQANGYEALGNLPNNTALGIIRGLIPNPIYGRNVGKSGTVSFDHLYIMDGQKPVRSVMLYDATGVPFDRSRETESFGRQLVSLTHLAGPEVLDRQRQLGISAPLYSIFDLAQYDENEAPDLMSFFSTFLDADANPEVTKALANTYVVTTQLQNTMFGNFITRIIHAGASAAGAKIEIVSDLDTAFKKML